MNSRRPEGGDAVIFLQLASRGWVSLRQFATIIGVSYPTAKRMMENGNFKATPVGGRHRIYQDEVDRFLREGNLPQTNPLEEGNGEE